MADEISLEELPYDSYDSLEDIFPQDFIDYARKQYQGNSGALVGELKKLFNEQGYLAEILTFQNGTYVEDGMLNVFGYECCHYSVLLMGEWVIDLLNSDEIVKTRDFILKLMHQNPKLKITPSLTTGWYAPDGKFFQPNIQYLLNYKY